MYFEASRLRSHSVPLHAYSASRARHAAPLGRPAAADPCQRRGALVQPGGRATSPARRSQEAERQSDATYNETYAPTVRPESVRLFHVYAVEYAWPIQQYDVPQAFLRSDADCDIFAYPPKGFAEFPGQLLKLIKCCMEANRLRLFGTIF